MEKTNKDSNKYNRQSRKGLQFVKIMRKNVDFLQKQQTHGKNLPIGFIMKNCIIMSQAFKIQEEAEIYGQILASKREVHINQLFKLVCNGFTVFPLSEPQFRQDSCCQFSDIPATLQDHKYYICTQELYQRIKLRRRDGKIVYNQSGIKGSPIVYVKDEIVYVIGFHEEQKQGYDYILNVFTKKDNNQLLINHVFGSLESDCCQAVNNPQLYPSFLAFYNLKQRFHNSSCEKIPSGNDKGSYIYSSSFNSSRSCSHIKLSESKQSIVLQLNQHITENQIGIIYNDQLSTFIIELDRLVEQLKDKKKCTDFNLSNMDFQLIDGKLQVKFASQDSRTFSLEDEYLVKRLDIFYRNEDKGQQAEGLCLQLFGQNYMLDLKVRKDIQRMIQDYKIQQKKEDVIKQAIGLVRQNAYYCLIKQFEAIIKKMYYIYQLFIIKKEDVKKEYRLDYIFRHYDQFVKKKYITKDEFKSNYSKFIQTVKDLHNSEIHCKNLKDNRPIRRLLRNWINQQQLSQFQELMIELNKAMHEYLRNDKLAHVATSETILGTHLIFKNPVQHELSEQKILEDQAQIFDVIACLVEGNMQLQKRKVLHNDLKLENVIKIGNNYKIIDLQQSFYCLLDQGQKISYYESNLYKCNKKLFQFYIKIKQRSPIKSELQFKQDVFYVDFEQRYCQLPNLIDYKQKIEDIIGYQLENHAKYFRYYCPRRLQTCLNTILANHPIIDKLQDDINKLSDAQCPQNENWEKYERLLERIKQQKQNHKAQCRGSRDYSGSNDSSIQP